MNPKKATKCGVCATPNFERNNYFYGKQFTVRDLLQEQSYVNEKRQLINRMVLGWGVVCGLEVTWDPGKRQFTVGSGMALDCCGHEIIVCEPQKVDFEQYKEQCGHAGENPNHKEKFVLCLEYHECKAEPVDLPAVACGEEERSEFNRVRDGFKLSVKRWDDDCHKPSSSEIKCINRYKKDSADLGDPPANPCRTETIHEYLCHKLTEGCPECKDCACVVLATIHVKAGHPYQAETREGEQAEQQQDDTQAEQDSKYYQPQPGYEPIKVKVDTCSDRRFVYNNPLLYDLIYCYHGDLPHIVDFNWRKYARKNREIDWDSFVKLVKNGLTVYFDREMERASLSPETFFLSFLHEDPDSGNIFVKRIPARKIRPDHAGDCFTATWLPDEAWFNDELISAKSQLRGGVNIEITIRGSRIWDDRGKGLDGAFLKDKLPTGNGTQGTEFIDWFRVLPRSNKKPKAETYDKSF